MPEWLLSPIDPSRLHDVSVLVAWHARLMVAAWVVLIPLGILAARFFKIMPRQDWPQRLDNPAWWHAHRALQYTGGVMTIAAAALILSRNGAPAFASMHALIGWPLLALALLQFASAWLRGSKGGPTAPAPDGSLRGDHYDMTRHRIIFERIHKSAGYLAVLAAVCAIITGLWQANAPVWMWLAVGAWWVALAAAFTILQRRGRAIDTYQAIWGPDPALPGNRIAPIGFGVRRLEP